MARRKLTKHQKQMLELKRRRTPKRVHLDFQGDPDIRLGGYGHGSDQKFTIDTSKDLDIRHDKLYVIESCALIYELKLEYRQTWDLLPYRYSYVFEVVNCWYVGTALPHLGLEAFREGRTELTPGEKVLLDTYKNPARW